jgi:hypothetical protein
MLFPFLGGHHVLTGRKDRFWTSLAQTSKSGPTGVGFSTDLRSMFGYDPVVGSEWGLLSRYGIAGDRSIAAKSVNESQHIPIYPRSKQ